MAKSKNNKRTPPTRPLAPSQMPNMLAKRKQWTELQMTAAMAAMDGSGKSINRIALEHGVPPLTLRDRLSGRVIHGTKPGPVPYLNVTEEEELEIYLVEASTMGYGKTRRQVKAIVGNVAKEKGMLRKSHISDGWWRRFLERHPKLSLRYGDATGHVRMDAVTKENITNYFDLLKECLEEHDFASHPERIYNMDESGVPLDPKPPRVVTRKGQRKVRYRSKGQVTVIGCCNGTGQAIPPMVIFNAKQLNPLWTKGEVPGTRYGLSDKGWTDQVLFKGWLKDHFLVHAVPGRPLLLLVDGHSSHFEPATLRYAAEHGVIIFCLPPHTTHEAQPLHVSFFGPLKKNWSEVCHDFYQSSPGKVITKFNFSDLFAKAWLKTCTPATICSGFRKAGVIPFNPNALLKLTPENVTENVSASGDLSSSASRGSTSSASGGSTSLASGGSTSLASGGSTSLASGGSTSSSSGGSTSFVSGGSTSSSSSGSTSFASTGSVEVEDNENGYANEELYRARLEEGYDIYDPDYVEWLYMFHPEVTPPEPLESSLMSHFEDVEPACEINHSSPVSPPSSSILVLETPPSSSTLVLETPPSSSALVLETPPSSSTLVLETPPSSPTFSSPLPLAPPIPPVPSAAPIRKLMVSCSASATAHALPSSNTVCSTTTPSPNVNPISSTTCSSSALSKHLQPVSLLKPSNPQKTGRARVLTSADCLKMLEEKKEKKRIEAELKEQRKKEREQRKKERELSLKKKKEERALNLKRKREAAASKKPPAKKARGRPQRGKQGSSSGPSTASSSAITTVSPTSGTTTVSLTSAITTVLPTSATISTPTTVLPTS